MMIKNRVMKGISFLLCLGFLSVSNNAVSKTTISDIDTTDCTTAQRYVNEYNSYNECQSQKTAVDNAQTALDSACAVYQSIKSEYKKCTNGEMDKSKAQVGTLSKAQSDLSACQSALNTALNNAKDAASACKKDKEKAEKASNKADKTQEKADKAQQENAAAQAALQEAEASYNNAVANCEIDPNSPACSQLKDLYKAYEKAAKKAGKTAKAEAKATSKNNSAQDAKDLANEKSGMNSCSGDQIWNGQECVRPNLTQEDIEQCGGQAYYFNGSCYNDQSERDNAKAEAAKKAAEQKAAESQKAYNDAQAAYNQCLSKNNNDPSKCEGEEEAMDNALRVSADAAASLAGNTGGVGSTSGSGTGVTKTEIDNMVQEATKPKCSGVSKTGEARGTFGIFDYLACKITTVVADLRVIVYILAGFGMIAFAYSAIIGKINFKQLANIGIGLFILSMTTGIIEEIVFNDGTSHLQYGDFLPNGNHEQYFQTTSNCDTNRELCPDVGVTAEGEAASKTSWSIKDLKSTIKSVTNAAKTVTNTYKTVRNTVDNTIQAADNIGNAIKNGGSPIDVAASIAGNLSSIGANVTLAAATLGSGASSITGDLKGATMSGEQRAHLENLQNQYNILKGKCDNGNCSKNELDALANMEAQVAANTSKVDNWLNTTGADITNYIGNASNIANQASSVAIAAQAGQNEGNAIGDTFGSSALGNILGAAMGAGSAYTAGSDALDSLQNSGSFDFRSQETKTAQAEAAALAAAQGGCSALGGTYNSDAKTCTGKNGESIDMATGWATKKNPDGSTTSVRKEGDTTTTKTVNADGSTTTTTVNADGSSVTIANKNGHTVVITKDPSGKTTEATVDGMSTDHQECITTRGGRWNAAKKQCEGMTKTADGCGNETPVRYQGRCMTEQDKADIIAAEKLKAAQEACVQKADYEWDGKSCNPKPKEETKSPEQMEQEIQKANLVAHEQFEKDKAACEAKKGTWEVIDMATWQGKCREQDQVSKNNEALATQGKAPCEAKGCEWVENNNWGNYSGVPLTALQKRQTGCYVKGTTTNCATK